MTHLNDTMPTNLLATHRKYVHLLNNLRLVRSEIEFHFELFCYSKDRAKADHAPWDFEFVL